MTDANNRFNIDDIYEKGIDVPMNPSDPVYVASEAGWPNIDWDRISVEGEVRDALAAVGTQLHYTNLSQVLLLGDVIRGKTDINAKRLAILIAETRMRDVDAWGKYLSRLGEIGDISPSIEEYFERLYEDENMVSQIIGSLLTDVLVTAVYENMDGTDTTLEMLVERNVGQAERNIRLSDYYLSEWIDGLAADERRGTAARIDRYITLKEQFIENYADTFTVLDISADAVADDFRDEACTFQKQLLPDDR